MTYLPTPPYIFFIQVFILHESVLSEYWQSSFKSWTPQVGHGDLLEDGCNDFDWISVIYGSHIPK
jgi:hypothetical protein